MGSSRARTGEVKDFKSRLLKNLHSESEKESQLVSEVESFESAAEKAKNKDRSTIARWLVGSFIVLIFILVIYVLVGPFVSRTVNGVEEAATSALTITTSVLLPVVTLVLGYYFGTSQNQT